MEKLNAKNIIRVLAIILICMFFVPTFLISCGDQSAVLGERVSEAVTQEKSISAGQIMTGITFQGEKVTQEEPGLIFWLLLPASLLIIWCISQGVPEKVRNIYTVAVSGVDIILWFALSSKVEEKAEQNYCHFETTGWFWVNIILLILVLGLGICLCANIIKSDTPFLKQNGAFLASENLLQNGWVCPGCRKVNAESEKFCIYCGRKKEVEESESYSQKEEEKTIAIKSDIKKEGTVQCCAGEYEGAEIPVGETEILIGREESSVNIVIKGKEVSRRHCGIRYNPAERNYIVTDYSTNGTFYKNGQKFKENVPTACGPGTILVIAQSGNEFLLK